MKKCFFTIAFAYGGLHNYTTYLSSASDKTWQRFWFFQSLTNWGRDELITDLTADDDSIQVVAFYSYEGPASNSIGWRLDYGDAFLEGTTDITVQDSAYATVGKL